MNTPKQIWEQYKKGVDYKNAIDLYDTVRTNEDFYIGEQWKGVNAPDLQKPTLNFLKRVVAYTNAMIVSDDIAVSFAPFKRDDNAEMLASILGAEVERIIEQTKAKALNRDAIRNASVDGDACMHVYFDPDKETGQDAKGEVRLELIENINVYFGNPYITEVQDQPYIIIAQRKLINEVKKEAEANGINAEGIIADMDNNQGEEGDDNQLCTVLVKYWKENGSVHCIKCTEHAIVKKPWNTEYKLYPISWMNWERIKSSCHGRAIITGLIQNQISVNKLFAMAIRSVEMMAFPKVVYDSTKLPKGWSNRVGEAIGVEGGVENFMTSVRGADFSGQVMEIVDKTISMTRDFMGASDAALGNVKPDNTSAIIAVQQASSAPLELQRRSFYQFIEDYIRIILDVIRADYGVRTVYANDEGFNQMSGEMLLDFSRLENMNLQLNVDIGSSSYFSELTQTQTMDNLFAKGLITDTALYLDSIPDKYVRNKQKLIESLKQQQEMAQQAQQQQPQGMNIQDLAQQAIQADQQGSV